MNRFKDPWQDYHDDPAFKHLVDMMTALVMQADYTPSEVRRAAVMAMIHVEQIRPAPNIMIHAGHATIAERFPRRQRG